MRRWITILLLVLLPMQLGWAALGSYCQHEGGKHTKHLGHHSHQHKPSATSEDAPADPQTGKSQHGDCNACFSASITPLLGELSLLVAATDSPGATGFQAYPLFRPASPPDRPDWAHLA